MENTTEKNKAAVRNLYENVLNDRKFELLDKLISSRYSNAQGVKGAKAFSTRLLEFIQAFPDARWTITELVAEGDKVFVKQKVEGIHKAPYQGIAATNKFVTNEGTGIYEFKNGKIVYNRIQTDRLGFLQQLGVVPTDLALTSQEKAQQVFFIDKFFIPKDAIEEFTMQTQYNIDFIKKLPGLIKYEAMSHRDSTGNLTLMTMAVWQKQDYMEKAKIAAMAEYKKINFDPPAFMEKLKVKMERQSYKAFVE